MTTLDAELKAAMAAMEDSFHVRLIGTFKPDLVCVPHDKPAKEWLKESPAEYDQFPVTLDESIVGLLFRGGELDPSSTASQAMLNAYEGVIVSADMPIADLIPELQSLHAKLVLRGSRIDGLVTQSDLLKLPVRILVFGLTSHLELCLRTLIHKRMPGQGWLERLADKDRARILKEQRRLKAKRFEPDALEFSTLSDLVRVLASEEDLGETFESAMKSIRDLRNDTAHSKTFITSPADVYQFADTFVSLRSWINQVTKLVEAAQ